MITGIVTILYVYGVRIFNFNIGIDTELFLDDIDRSRQHWIALGRYGLVLLQYIFKHTSTNVCADVFVAGALLLSSGLVLCYLLSSFSAKKIPGPAMALFLVFYLSSSVWAEMIYFSYMSAETMLSVLLASVIVAFMIHKVRTGYDLKALIISSFLIMLITSIYQASLMFLVGVLAASILLLGDDETADGNTCFKGAIMCALTVICGAACYFLSNTLIKALLLKDSEPYLESMIHIGQSDYLFRFGAFLFEVFGADIPVINTLVLSRVNELAGSEFVQKVYWNSTISCFWYVPAIVMYIVIVIKRSRKRGSKDGLIQALSGLTVLFSVLFLAILGGNVEVRALYALAFAGAFMLVYNIVNADSGRLRTLLLIIFAAAVYIQTQRSALMITSDQMRYEYDRNLAESIIRDVEMKRDGAVKGDNVKICFYGNSSFDASDNFRPGRVIGHSIFEWEGNGLRIVAFMHDLGYKKIALGDTDQEVLRGMCENMPVYPMDGSIRFVGDTAVVKLSE